MKPKDEIDEKIEMCRNDFYGMLKAAMEQAGGKIDITQFKTLTLVEVVNIVAQNGIRMVFMEDKHMDALTLGWIWKKEAYQCMEPPKKKQLLCDVHDENYDENIGAAG